MTKADIDGPTATGIAGALEATEVAGVLGADATPASGWWRSAVVYQVYPRSFADGDGDGVGDLPGVREKLPYLAGLGVDALWLSPFYPSGGVDAGYDVVDPRGVDLVFGTLADLDAVLAEAHALGIRVIIDLVPNHSSSRHPWFVEALAAEPGSPERARYLFRPGRGDGPPNDWPSKFGGSAWTRVAPDDEWYLHLYDAGQPDFDWSNPEVRAEYESILRFWLDRGVDGFRVDVAHGLVKAPGLPDLGRGDEPLVLAGVDTGPMWDQDGVHDIYRAWRRVLGEYGDDRILVAEAWATEERVALYLRPDEMHQAFDFRYLGAGWDAAAVAGAVSRAVEISSGVGASPTWVLSNHDVVRAVSRFGRADAVAWSAGIGPDDAQPDLTLGTRRARAGALLTLGLPGSAYLYQGEELGLPDHTELPPSARRDPVFRRTGGASVGRDGARIPMPWHAAHPGLGFGGHPWLPQPESYGALAVDVQEGDRMSTLSLYRRALALRRRSGAGAAEFAECRLEGRMLTVTTSALRVVVNFGGDPVRVDGDPGALLLESVPGALRDGMLAADAAVWLRL